MSRIELFVLLSLGFLTFLVVFIRIGFALGVVVTPLTLPLAMAVYMSLLFVILSFMPLNGKVRLRAFTTTGIFLVFSILIGIGAWQLGNTYDISWDGQGYHQTAVIALTQGWNPLFEPSIQLLDALPSQIFAEGYPSALWEIESSVYVLTERINSAKIFNSVIAVVALFVTYSLMRKLSIGRVLSGAISLLVVMQPIFILQLLTFMQDGFGYELIVIAITSLVILMISPKSYWSAPVFIMAEVFLVSTKYSHLPIALILGIIFILLVLNRLLNKDYILNKTVISIVGGVILISLIFAYLPYGRNLVFHGTPFYPTNIPELMGSVKYNNIPQNLQGENKVTLLFYGIFSKSQPKESGDPRSKLNVAELKLPFLFTQSEVEDAGGHFNNRVGAGGPLFSGVVLSSILLVTVTAFAARTKKQRYAIYTALFGLGTTIFLALLAPTPNLLRYVNQLQLIPFVAIVPLYVVFKNKYVNMFTILILLLVATNIILFSSVVFAKNAEQTELLNDQLSTMKNSGESYNVQAQHFYSSYIILAEQNIPFTIVNVLPCRNLQAIVTSSTTTQFCVAPPQ